MSGNVCEHGDHPAPEGKRFCSAACEECEHTDHPTGCAGICKRCPWCGHPKNSGACQAQHP